MSGRILIVDDVATNRMLLSLLLSKAFYDVDEAGDGHAALEIARRTRPDVALVDVMMPGMNGYELCRAMKSDPELADIPVVMVTALGAQDDRLTALAAGADDFLTKPVRELALFARLRSLLRMKAMTDELRLRDDTMRQLLDSPPPALIMPTPGARVLSVTSDANGAMLKDILASRLDVRIETVTTAKEAFLSAAASPPEALLVDSVGFADFTNAFTTALRQRPETRGAALLTLVAADDLKTAADSLDAGANDYLMYPLDPAELTARLRTQLRYKAYADQLRAQVSDGLRQAVTDPLTGLRNRRYLDAHLARIAARAVDDDSPLCLMAFDLDRFKSVNDRHGHAAGDAVLRQFAQRLLDNTRGVDLVARIGGEEFVVAMPEASLNHARIAAERVRKAVETPGFDIGGQLLDVTVSVGVAEFIGHADTPEALMERADAALYASKNAGRNRVTLAAA
ncbi:PleD family two-component system response regulator [Rubrimonas cliftonensis]|uniref:diguanylate cyclase n=1 Tax=Rubrimonas cliftonensis TaxID=89524 RepID=A0A1H4BZM2_9RHOB|nr:PleD family two-component system response regulator [Rubrimonas cliftonensis]SEA53534.1 response regulator receiver modulated diguanylate cyclase [Rubrimonas cliftonensis]